MPNELGAASKGASDPNPVERGVIQSPAANPTTELAQPKLPSRDPYAGAATKRVSQEQSEILMAPVDRADVEIRPDGIVYLPEIKYRRTLNRAFGPMGWALIPRGPVSVVKERVNGHGGAAAREQEIMTREYALVVDGRFAAEARGEQEYFAGNATMSYATAAEAVKSNAMMRCCKDLGIASELWDPVFIETWKHEYAVKVRRKGIVKPSWRRKDRDPFYDEVGPYDETQPTPSVEAPKLRKTIDAQATLGQPVPAEPGQREPGQDDEPAPPAQPPSDNALLRSRPEEGVLEGMVEAYTKPRQDKQGHKNWGINVAGEWVNAYDEQVADFAAYAKRQGIAVRLTYQQNGTFRKVLRIREA